MDVRLIVLGSGQDGGAPQFGAPRGRGPTRTASSVAVVADGSILLLDASPDLRTQYETLGTALGDASPAIGAVGITHGHMGHYAGLVHFGKEAADTVGIPLIATSSVLAFLGGNEPWATLLAAGNLEGVPIDDAPVQLGPLSIEGIPVGIDGHPSVLYLPDIDSWTAWPEAEETIAAHPIAFVDATFGDPAELPGRDLSAIPHPLVTDTIERFRHLTDETAIVLTHLNHSNGLADPDSPLAASAIAAGFIVAHDGLEIEGIDTR
jgi:pyrroloquinoline quinone biosynthesis protein B